MVVRLSSARRDIAALAGALVVTVGAPALAAPVTVTILHNNDAESQLLGADGQPSYGGAARFVSLVNRTKAESTNPILISSGDNFLPGPEFSASLASGTFYDARLINQAGYDAVILGNHDFDFGPDTLATFIAQTDADIPFLSSNLDVSAEPNLQSLATQGRIASSTIVTVAGGERVGIVGATTPELRKISSPRNVAQIAGFEFEYNPVLQPQVQDDLTGTITQEGSRVLKIVIDGVTVFDQGVVLPGYEGLTLDIATIDFLARGGDGYPFGELDFTALGVSYQQALLGYIQEDLSGVIPGDGAYAVGGEGRIATTSAVPIPSPVALPAGLGLAALGALRRRR